MSDANQLREQAAKAFRLAASISDTKAKEGLEAFGRELERQAAELEREEDSVDEDADQDAFVAQNPSKPTT